MNKTSLVTELTKRTKLARGDVAAVVDAMLGLVRDVVVKGQRVSLAGFGTFERRRRSPRTGRNPHTRAAVPIPARNLPSFRPSPAFRDAVASPRRRARARKPARRR
jgi:DNA-binding protein HU-beta